MPVDAAADDLASVVIPDNDMADVILVNHGAPLKNLSLASVIIWSHNPTEDFFVRNEEHGLVDELGTGESYAFEDVPSEWLQKGRNRWNEHNQLYRSWPWVSWDMDVIAKQSPQLDGLRCEFDEIQQAQRLDLIFCIDTTGSMRDDIAAVKSSASDIINEVASSIPDSRIAVVAYRDFGRYLSSSRYSGVYSRFCHGHSSHQLSLCCRTVATIPKPSTLHSCTALTRLH